jgi:hypothetical protein
MLFVVRTAVPEQRCTFIWIAAVGLVVAVVTAVAVLAVIAVVAVAVVTVVAVVHSDRLFSVSYKLYFHIVPCAMAQTVSRLPVTAKDWDRCQTSPFGFYGGQNGTAVISDALCHATSSPYMSSC